ncbi:MAG: phenylalanine--tRNA ligase subunit alpha [Pelagibacteraceae bacterium]|nr:phenylalanine--tRNA ligase subunit alpha [Pelagibacteraceae bacterium]|tara:strand:+ start:3131 stop:4180 length:1050 start_codon:yes stop_codon:yes gene_type:complete
MDIKKVLDEATKELISCEDEQSIHFLRVKYLGKKGLITDLLKTLKDLTDNEKKEFGSSVNIAKENLLNQISVKSEQIRKNKINEKLSQESIEITFPSPNLSLGKIHPISKTFTEVIDIFGNMGFAVAEGPDIETDFNNFTALNIPEDHPAREMQDTFYLEEKDQEGKPFVLRTHTSPVQIRTMNENQPPIKIIAPGRTYRCDSDSTHSPMFHQVEGLLINDSANMGHLKGTLVNFCKDFFQINDLKTRFRPSYFPFTEPSAEMDIAYSVVDNQIKLGEGDKWLEILGCGMVNPKVLDNCKIDSSKYQGYAFGIGLDRITMLKYGLTDIRSFFNGNFNWLDENGFGLGRF